MKQEQDNGVKKTIALIGGFALFSVMVTALGYVLVGYVIVHFVSKFW